MKKIAFCFITLIATSALGKTIKIPQDFSTIQAGIDNSVNGDTILLDAGVYSGAGNFNIDFHGKKIVLKSSMGRQLTTIDCNSLGRGFYFHSNEDSLSVIDGITIVNGAAPNTDGGGGIYCFWSSPKIINSTIQNSTAGTEGRGGGISLMNSSLVLRKCTIQMNNAEYGGGMNLYNSSPLISHSVISQNTANHFGGLAIMNYSNPKISFSSIESNAALDDAGGISIYYGCIVQIKNSKISGNMGEGFRVTNFSELTLENCLISNNSKDGIWASLLTNNNLVIKNSNVVFNKGRGLYSQNTHYILTNSIVYGNEAEEIFLWNPPLPDISYSIVQGKDSGGIIGTINWSGVNYDADPLFMDPANKNYDISDSSPAINAGDPLEHNSGQDLAGRSRIFNRRIDIGAYESRKNEMPVVVASLEPFYFQENFGSYDIDLHSHFSDDGGDENLTYNFLTTSNVVNAIGKEGSVLEISSKLNLFGLDTVIIKISDSNGLYAYDSLPVNVEHVEIVTSADSENDLPVIFPNPVKSTLNLWLDPNESYTIQILDAQGSLRTNQNVTCSKMFIADVSSLASGLHLLYLQGHSKVTVLKFFKE